MLKLSLCEAVALPKQCQNKEKHRDSQIAEDCISHTYHKLNAKPSTIDSCVSWDVPHDRIGQTQV